ncbi:glucan endo-1,3-beta-D-glucosidase ARB_01444-like [Cornus florida]|uniref:glucan endo-1,3-beta-D-glucosidase ARB_01444-like n=1 Tax=Cornus florida TaxID=4283 RepID=UPI0028A28410|nr:glucan endo-1,3-beta-D-glucosidase ARB_01444-like [Cornus florida]
MLKEIQRRVKTTNNSPKPHKFHKPSQPPRISVSMSFTSMSLFCLIFMLSFNAICGSATKPIILHESLKKPTFPFLFPKAKSSVLPDPSLFFSPHLLSTPLPTNSFFQNFALNRTAQPEYIHPYLFKPSLSSLSLSYPSQFSNSSIISQIFKADLTISESKNNNKKNHSNHVISSYSDLSVTLDIPSSNLRFFLVRGSPFLTCSVAKRTELSISTIHTILRLSSNSALTKHAIKLKNKQTWLLYSSSPIKLSTNKSVITSDGFSGIIRIAISPDSDDEPILDRFSSRYPVSGNAIFTKPFQLEYKWDSEGNGDLLMLAHPLHIRLLSANDCKITVLKDFKYKSIDGELVGVVGDSWVLKTAPIQVTWHSIKGVKKESYPQIINALHKDVKSLQTLNSTTLGSSSYFYGKRVAKAARLALIAEEVSYPKVIPAILDFLKEKIEPWLDGTFGENAFLYDEKWGGLVTKQGSNDTTADFGFGIYNDHHFHLGYFLYSIAVLAKIDPAWGQKYRPQAYSLVTDYMNLDTRANSNYPRLRCFDLWKLHSWAAGLTEFPNGRNQESTSEAVNAYNSAALLGLAYGDTNLVATGSTLEAMEIQSAQTWWHVKEGSEMYAKKFTKENRVVGILWANKRDSALWFAPPEWRECRLGIQLLPILPISEVLFSDAEYAKELVKWTLPALKREGGVEEGWKGFLYALQGIYDNGGALHNIKNLTGYDDGNTLSNLLWWIHSRDVKKIDVKTK